MSLCSSETYCVLLQTSTPEGPRRAYFGSQRWCRLTPLPVPLLETTSILQHGELEDVAHAIDLLHSLSGDPGKTPVIFQLVAYGGWFMVFGLALMRNSSLTPHFSYHLDGKWRSRASCKRRRATTNGSGAMGSSAQQLSLVCNEHRSER